MTTDLRHRAARPGRADDLDRRHGLHKVEPVMADGGEVILYAPPIRGIATSHPEVYEVGYQNLDYRDPETADVAASVADMDTLVVPRAAEVLFR